MAPTAAPTPIPITAPLLRPDEPLSLAEMSTNEVELALASVPERVAEEERREDLVAKVVSWEVTASGSGTREVSEPVEDKVSEPEVDREIEDNKDIVVSDAVAVEVYVSVEVAENVEIEAVADVLVKEMVEVSLIDAEVSDEMSVLK